MSNNQTPLTIFPKMYTERGMLLLNLPQLGQGIDG